MQRRANFSFVHSVMHDLALRLVDDPIFAERTDEVIRPSSGDRLFHIGCGPGALLRCLPQTTSYVGFDRNEAYIQRARKMHGSRGEFICDDVGNFAAHALAPADIAVAIAAG